MRSLHLCRYFTVGYSGRSFLWFLASAFASALGRNAYQIACAWLLIVSGQGSRAVAAFFAIVSVVELIASPIAGWMVDRYDRRALYMSADSIRFIGSSVLAILLVANGSPWLIWVSVAVFAAFDRIALTSSQCMIPSLSSHFSSVTINSTVFFLIQSGSLCAASLVGLLLHSFPPSVAFVCMAMAFGVSVFCMLFVEIEPVLDCHEPKTECEEFFIDANLLYLAAVYALLYAGGMLVSVIGPGFVFDEMKGNALDFGYLESAWSAGSILGALLLIPVLRAAKISALHFWVLLFTAIFFVLLKMLTLPLIFVAFAILGALYNLGRVGVELMLQLSVPIGALGRAKGAIHCSAVLFGLLLFGTIAVASIRVAPSTIFLIYGTILGTATSLLRICRLVGHRNSTASTE